MTVHGQSVSGGPRCKFALTAFITITSMLIIAINVISNKITVLTTCECGHMFWLKVGERRRFRMQVRSLRSLSGYASLVPKFMIVQRL